MSYCDCSGPISAGRGLKALMLGAMPYDRIDRAPTDIEEARSPELVEWDDCWSDCRIAMQGVKAVREDAIKRGWLELPEHISWLHEHGSAKQKTHADKAKKAYVERAQYDDMARRARDVVIGSVLRKDIMLSDAVTEQAERGVGTLTSGDLDRADSKGRTLKGFADFLLKEKGTTRFTAVYTFMSKDSFGRDVGKWKAYTAENIWDIDYQQGQLVYIVFREYESVEGQNRFDRHKTQVIFRELSLELINPDNPASARRVVERIWRKSDNSKKFEVSEDQAIVVRETNLTEIPVVIDGGPVPEAPMFQAMCEKAKELFQVSAQIKYRQFKMAHPTPHLNYTDEPNKAYIVKGKRAPTVHALSAAAELKNGVAKEKARPALVPGTLFQTQNAEFKYVYDDGTGVDILMQEREECKKDLESLGANYGITTNNSNVAENTERLRQGKDTAFMIAHIAGTSEALTQSARWLAIFNGVTNEQRVRDINIELNLCLTDEGPTYTFEQVCKLLEQGWPRLIVVRMFRQLAPSIVEDMTDDEVVEFMRSEEAAAIFGPDEIDQIEDEEPAEAA